MTTDLFSNNDPILDDNYEMDGVTATEDLVTNLVGEDKKYKTVNDLAYSKLSADAFINRLKNENKQLRDQLKSTDDIKSLINGFKEAPPKEASNPVQDGGESGAFDPDTLVEKVLSSLEARNAKAREEQNMEQVKNTVQTALGPNWRNEVKQRLVEADLSDTEADAIARRNPKAFFKLLGIGPTQEPSKPSLFDNPAPRSTVNTTSQAPMNVERNQTYYNNLKQKMGLSSFYSNPTLQAQMHNDALRLGEKFFNA